VRHGSPVFAAMLVAACGGRAVPAPPPSVAEPDLGTGSLAGLVPPTLDAQLVEGERVFLEECATCHGVGGRGGAAPPIAGLEGLDWAPRPESAREQTFYTAADLVAWLHESMPADRPGTLSEGAYYNATAFVLAINDVPLPPMGVTVESAPAVALAAR
jgi:cytochrome c5